MTRETAKEYLPLVQALAEGKTIQLNVGGWQDTVDVDFSHPVRYYRIKPEPRRWWIVKCSHGESLWHSKETAIITGGCGDQKEIIEVVEVLK